MGNVQALELSASGVFWSRFFLRLEASESTFGIMVSVALWLSLCVGFWISSTLISIHHFALAILELLLVDGDEGLSPLLFFLSLSDALGRPLLRFGLSAAGLKYLDSSIG